jgi:hypothetical protein
MPKPASSLPPAVLLDFNFPHVYVLVGETGSFIAAGGDAQFVVPDRNITHARRRKRQKKEEPKKEYILHAGPGAFWASSGFATFTIGRHLEGAGGRFVLQGGSAGFNFQRILPAHFTGFTSQGGFASFRIERILQGNTGDYRLAGGDAQLIIDRGPTERRLRRQREEDELLILLKVA